MNADEPIDNQNSSDKDDSPEGKIEQAVEAIAEDYLKRLRRGESESYDELVRQHPDLAPYLESKLKFYLAVYRATRLTLEGDASDDVTVDFSIFSSPPKIHRDHVYRINCPHCGNQVQVVDDRVREIVCTSCGSSVRVHSDVAKKLSEKTPPPMPKQLGHFRIVRMLGEGGFGVVSLRSSRSMLNSFARLSPPRRRWANRSPSISGSRTPARSHGSLFNASASCCRIHPAGTA